MSKINYNRPSFVKNTDVNEEYQWKPNYPGLWERASRDGLKSYVRRVKEDTTIKDIDKYPELKRAREELNKPIIPEGLQVQKCPPRTQHHVPESYVYNPDFEDELRKLKKEVQKISRNNAANEQRHSSHCITRTLDDKQAIYVRKNFKDYTVKQMAKKFKVSERCITRCLKGITYKHLNSVVKPQL